MKPSLHASLCACMYTHLSIHTRMMYYAGLLKPVSNLTVTHINSTTVLISWCPPFTLEGIPILGYNVTCTNTTSGKNETMSMKGDTTMLYYSIDHPDSENSFTVTVVPINEDGSGKNASLIFLSELFHYEGMTWLARRVH